MSLDVMEIWVKNADDHELPDGPMTAEQEVVVATLSHEVIAGIDAGILANAKLHARKVGMIVGLTMMEPTLRVRGLPDLFYRDRVKALVEDGKLVAEGNLDYMRFSEVRLPTTLTPDRPFHGTPDDVA